MTCMHELTSNFYRKLLSRNVAVKEVYVVHRYLVVHVFTIFLSRNTLDRRVFPAALLQVILATRHHFGFVHPSRMGCDISHYWGYYFVYAHYFMCMHRFVHYNLCNAFQGKWALSAATLVWRTVGRATCMYVFDNCMQGYNINEC